MDKQTAQKIVLGADLLFPFDQNYPITSTYQDHLDDKANNRHLFPGTDYGVWYVREIVAPTDGTLIFWEDRALGKDAVFLFEYAGDEYRFDFAHCSWVAIEELHGRKQVKRGEVIAKAGNTGFVLPKPTESNPYAGTHVHVSLRINFNKNSRSFLDPTHLLQAMFDYKEGRLLPPKPVGSIFDAEVEIATLKVDLERARDTIQAQEAQIGALEREISANSLTSDQTLTINEVSMDTAKTLSETLTDGGKYIALAQPIGAFLALLISRALEATGDEIAIITAGATALVNVALIVGFWVSRKLA